MDGSAEQEECVDKRQLRRSVAIGLIAASGLLALGSIPARADTPSTGSQAATSDAAGDGLLSGNSVAVPVAAPIGVCGNGAGVGVLGLGVALGACDVGGSDSGAPASTTGPQLAASSASGDGVLSGNSVAAPVAVPVDVCGNAAGVGVLGAGAGMGIGDCGPTAADASATPSPFGASAFSSRSTRLLGSPSTRSVPFSAQSAAAPLPAPTGTDRALSATAVDAPHTGSIREYYTQRDGPWVDWGLADTGSSTGVEVLLAVALLAVGVALVLGSRHRLNRLR